MGQVADLDGRVPPAVEQFAKRFRNLKRLKLDHPDIYEQYVTVSEYRRFTVKSDAEAA